MSSSSIPAPTLTSGRTVTTGSLDDVFAVQSEIAKTIAEQLEANISPNEKKAIERSPTSDLTAFDLYTRANTLMLSYYGDVRAKHLQAIDLLNQAVARDPSFFPAYCQLAHAHDTLYFLGMITPPNGYGWPKRLSKRHSGSDLMRAKRILRARRIFIRGISIMMEHWPSWRSPGICPTILVCSS